MCIGIPMQVIQVEPGYAWCQHGDRREKVDTTLVGNPPVGTWVLVFLGSARELLDVDHAAQITDALQALAAAAQGDSLDGFFADLDGREPQLPEFLRTQSSPQEEKSL